MLSDRSTAGTIVAALTVTTSNLRPFRGTLHVLSQRISSMAMFAISGSSVVLVRDLTTADSADGGMVTYTVTATENSVSVTATGTLMITSAEQAQIPLSVTLSNPMVTLPDTSVAGTPITVFSIATNDGQPFAGTVSLEGPP